MISCTQLGCSYHFTTSVDAELTLLIVLVCWIQNWGCYEIEINLFVGDWTNAQHSGVMQCRANASAGRRMQDAGRSGGQNR